MPTSNYIYLHEFYYVDYTDNVTKVFRQCTSASGYCTGPSDSPQNTMYLPHISEPFNFERRVLRDGVTGGFSGGGFGACIVLNLNGEYDAYRFHGFDGQVVRVLRGDPSRPYAEFTLLFTGTLSMPTFTENTIEFTVRDRTEDLTKDLQTVLYAGNNAPPAGIEGTATDIKGKTKPLCYGYVYNIEPVLVNSQKVIYQVHDGPVLDIVAAYSNGDPLTKGTNYADNAALQAATVTGGTYITCFAEGLLRLGPATNTIITCDVKGDASDTGYVDRPGDIIKRMVKSKAGYTDSDLNLAKFTTLGTLANYEIGVYFECGSTYSIEEAVDSFVEGLGIWVAYGVDGKLAAGVSPILTGLESPVLRFDESLVLRDSFTRTTALTYKDGKPPYKVTVKGQKIWRVHSTSEITGNLLTVNPTRAAWLQNEYRNAVAQDNDVKTLHKLATEFEIESLINDLTAAQTEATRILNLYKTNLDRITFSVTPPYAVGVSLGDIINLTLPRFGLDAGKNFVVVGITEDFPNDVVTMEVIG